MMKTVKELMSGGHLRPITIVYGDGKTITCLITEFRVDRSNDTENLYLYDVRHTDSDWCELATIEKHVEINWFGTLIAVRPIDLGADQCLEIITVR